MKITNLQNQSFQKIWVVKRNLSQAEINDAKVVKGELTNHPVIRSLDKKDIDLFILKNKAINNGEICAAFCDIKTPRRLYSAKGKDYTFLNSNSILKMARDIDLGKCYEKKNSKILDVINKAFQPRKRKTT